MSPHKMASSTNTIFTYVTGDLRPGMKLQSELWDDSISLTFMIDGDQSFITTYSSTLATEG